MEFNQYNTTVQQWIHTVLENRETNADVVLECCRDIIAYGRETDDPKLMGFGFFYGGEIYYELNDGAHFFHMMTEALTYLDRAEEWELVPVSQMKNVKVDKKGNLKVEMQPKGGLIVEK